MSDNTVAEIKDRLDIAEVIGSYMQLKKAGTNFKGLCPFHNEKSPSFVVTPSRQIWHCFGCFPPGQKVRTPFGLHNIEQIDENHYVYSGQGKIRRVLATHKRNFEGNLISVKVRKLGSAVSMTEDHNLEVVRPKTKYTKSHKQFYRQCRESVLKGKFASLSEAIRHFGNVIKITAGQLKSTDFVLFPINELISRSKKINLTTYLNKAYTFGPRPKKIAYQQPVDPELLKLVGYYIAEGSSNRAYIRFSLGNHEQEFAEEIVGIIKKLFSIKATIHRRNAQNGRSGIEVTACHAYLANIFENLCGKHAHNKHIPFEWQTLPLNLQSILLNAIHRGDGRNYIANKSKNIHKSIITVSRVLSEQLVDILLRKNIFPSLIIQKEKVDKKGVHHKESYSVVWSDTAKSQHNFVLASPVGAKYWLLPIKTLTKIAYKGPVHNLTVEKDHSYVATNFAVANCGEGGDVFSFVQKFENLDFVQTLKLLADRAGVKLPEYRPGTNLQEDEKELLVRINTFAARYYHEILIHPTAGKEAREYLLGRGLSKQTIENWQIGFAPNDFHSLSQALQQKKVTSQQAIKAGVVVKNEKGNIYDRFRGRITFPIFNYVGEAVGFSARILPKLDDGKTGKYINSPETLIYNKSRVLFGLNFAKNHIRKADEVIVVEGQMDCISAHQAGFLNTVASSGTAITPEHLSVLGRLTKNIKFCFDADSAGLLATRRAVEHLLGKDFNLKIVSIKGAKDPDELIKKDPKSWEKAVKEAPLFLEYYIERLFGEIKALTIETKKTLRNELLPLVKKLNDALEQEHYLKLLAKKLDATPGSLLEDMNKLNPGYKKPAGQKTEAQGETANNKAILQIEKLVLGGMLNEKNFLHKVIKEGEISDFNSAEIKELALNLFSGIPMAQSQNNLVLAKEAAFMVELLKQESPSTEAFTKDLTNAFFALRGRTLKQKQHELQAQIKAAEEKKDTQKLTELQKEFMDVAKQIVKYRI